MLTLGGIRTFAGMGLLGAVLELDFHSSCIPQLQAIMKHLPGGQAGDSEAGAGIIDLDVMQLGGAGIDHRGLYLRGAAACDKENCNAEGKRQEAKSSARNSGHSNSVNCAGKTQDPTLCSG